MANRNITVDGRRTSVALDPAFWRALDTLADENGEPPAALTARIAAAAPKGRIAAALRVYLIEALAERRAQVTPPS